MTVYIINVVMIAVMKLISGFRFRMNELRITGKWLSEMFLCAWFCAIMALRASTVGVDTRSYSKIFLAIGNSPSFPEALARSDLSAPVYVALCRALFRISQSPQILIIVTALIINIGLFVFIHKNSADPVFSAFCWVGLTLFYCSMNGSRQCMAAVFALHSLDALSKNLRDIKGWALLAVSVGVHATAIILLIAILGFYLEKQKRDSREIFFLSVWISLVFGVIFRIVVVFFIRIFPRYEMYVDGTSRYSVLKDTGGGRILLLYVFLFGLICLWLAGEGDRDTAGGFSGKKILSAVIFGTVFGAINCKNELINRMMWYYLALFVIFIPDLLYRCNKTQRLILGAGIVFVLLIYSFLSLRENQNGVVPYLPFWTN